MEKNRSRNEPKVETTCMIFVYKQWCATLKSRDTDISANMADSSGGERENCRLNPNISLFTQFNSVSVCSNL